MIFSEMKLNIFRGGGVNLLNIPYKICTLFILLFFLINFKIGHAQILLQPEIGTITSINSGTDRIIEMIREELEEEELIEEDEKSLNHLKYLKTKKLNPLKKRQKN